MSDKPIDIETDVKPNRIEDAIRQFKIELSINQNNQFYNKSGIGGDHEALFNVMLFGITIESDRLDNYISQTSSDRDAKLDPVIMNEILDSKNSVKPCFYFRDNTIILNYDVEEITVKHLREEFNKFKQTDEYKSNCVVGITEEQMVDLDYLQQYSGKSIPLEVYINCLKSCLKVKNRLSSYDAVLNNVLAIHCESLKDLTIKYAKDNNINIEFDSYKYRSVQYDQLMKLVIKSKDNQPYKYWHKYINVRHEVMMNNLYGLQEIMNFNNINDCPLYIKRFCVRKILGLETIIKYELDRYLNCD